MIVINEYFDGLVKSLGYTTTEGKSTIGVMEEGEYTFGTSSAEKMTIIEGKLDVLLTGESEWKSYTGGQCFEIPADSSFTVIVSFQTSYLCNYN